MELLYRSSRHLSLSRKSFPQFAFSRPLLSSMVWILTGLFMLSLFPMIPAQAAGDPPQQCPSGWVWSSNKGKCVKKTSELLSDDDLYAAAYKLIEEKQYALARDLLYRIKDQHQPRVLNYIGYTTRKLGRIDDGIRYYKMALELDPDYVQARQYLGEGYLQKGAVGMAKEQLQEIAARCGADCEHYRTLAVQISNYQRKSAS